MNHDDGRIVWQGDYLLGQMFYSRNEDCRWHREWTQVLIRMVIEDNSKNSETIQGWIEKCHPVAVRALQAFALLFEGKLKDAHMPPLEGVTQSGQILSRFLIQHGLATSEFRHSRTLNWITTDLYFLTDDPFCLEI
jgi:hypothetical protein